MNKVERSRLRVMVSAHWTALQWTRPISGSCADSLTAFVDEPAECQSGRHTDTQQWFVFNVPTTSAIQKCHTGYIGILHKSMVSVAG